MDRSEGNRNRLGGKTTFLEAPSCRHRLFAVVRSHLRVSDAPVYASGGALEEHESGLLRNHT